MDTIDNVAAGRGAAHLHRPGRNVLPEMSTKRPVGAAHTDSSAVRLGWSTLFSMTNVVGLKSGRRLAALFFRAAANLADSSYDKTVHRIVYALRDENPRLLKIPDGWHESPSVSTRRLGLRVELDLRDNLQAILFYTGRYEPSLLKFFDRELRRNDVVADVGAHIGLHAMIAAQLLRRRGGGHVYAFEPAADSARRIREGAIRNALDIHVEETALGCTVGSACLYADNRYLPADAGVRSLYASGAPVQAVTVTSFDRWAHVRQLDRLDVLKVDVEGSELGVIEGMQKSLERFRPRAVVVEMRESLQRRAGSSVTAIRKSLGRCGYQTTGRSFDHNELFRPVR